MTDDASLTARQPTLSNAAEILEQAIDQGLFVTAFGRCRVDYDGRASSTLEAGDRLVVLKPDGTVLVHTDEGQQPVNWQPPGCSHEVSTEDSLELRSFRDQPEEELFVTFESITHVSAFDATDEHDLALEGTETDMRDRILADPSLLEDGFKPRATERETAAGAVDIYGIDSEDTAVVIELKRRRVGPDAVSQLNRYVSALERDLHADKDVRGVLVAPSVTDSCSTLLDRHDLEFVSLSPVPET